MALTETLIFNGTYISGLGLILKKHLNFFNIQFSHLNAYYTNTHIHTKHTRFELIINTIPPQRLTLKYFHCYH